MSIVHTEIESVAYDTRAKPDRGYAVRAQYLKGMQNALIEIFKDGAVIREFQYPAYRIYNIVSHFDEIVDDMTDKDVANICPDCKGKGAKADNGIEFCNCDVPEVAP